MTFFTCRRSVIYCTLLILLALAPLAGAARAGAARAHDLRGEQQARGEGDPEAGAGRAHRGEDRSPRRAFP